jgi:hypothetical protein
MYFVLAVFDMSLLEFVGSAICFIEGKKKKKEIRSRGVSAFSYLPGLPFAPQ